ncbi:hypothetical protein B7P43_G10192 [Cryptotermes secundus]|uniref:Ubiquitin-like domain-containing protein n=1 Tax=Cryptotermes secundus TaxID=105785 RepID=A0A2J7RDD1_9NEOP|nr:hypothetical protein B7P43_G10192 [Cryptotermes secundus]
MEVWLVVYLSSVLDEDEWSDSCPGPFILGKEPVTPIEFKGGWAPELDWGIAMATMRFRFDGQPINETDTPISLEMEEGDTIEVYQQQTGGRRPYITC